MTYIVKAGDTLSGLYGSDWKNLSGYSGNPTKLQIGTQLNDLPKSSTLNLSGANNSTIINPSGASVIDNSGLHSDLKTQTAGIMAQMARIQSQIDAAQKAGYTAGDNKQIQKDATGNVIPATNTPPADQSNWDKIMAMFKFGQDKIAALPAVPTVEDQTNKILSTFGYTPESFKAVAGMNAELASTTDQLNKMEEQKNQQISDLSNNQELTGSDIQALTNKLNRDYAVKSDGLSAKGTLLQAQISTLTGDYAKAQTQAQNYVQLATTAQRQLVSDIEYSMNFYKDIYSAMDTSTQNAAQRALDNAYRDKVFAETQAQNVFNNAINSSQLKIDQQKAGIKEENTNITDILQNAIDQGATPANAARAAAAIYEGMGIQVTQANLNNWTSQASGMNKKVVPTAPSVTKTPLNPTTKNIGRTINKGINWATTLGNNPQIIGGSIVESGKAMGSFFSGLFGG